MYEYKAELIRIVDGDTYDLDIDLGMGVHRHERIRLADVNTPETYGVKKDSDEYLAGLEAKVHVQESFAMADAIVVRTKKDKKGKYGRYIADVLLYKDGEEWSLAESLVEGEFAERVKY